MSLTSTTAHDEREQTMTETTAALGAPRSLLAFLREGRPTSTGTVRDQKRTRLTRWVALGMLVLIPLIAVLGVFGGSAWAKDDDDNTMSLSFYKVASSTTAFFSTIQEPGNTTPFGDKWQDIIKSPADAGSLLGYADPDFSSVSGWLASKLSGSSDAIGYDTLLISNGDDTKHSGSNFQGMINYAYYGAALNGMGLDGTSTGLSVGFMNWISGGVVMLLFILGGSVDFLFNSIISVLGLLNPFKLFYVGVQAIDPSLADGMTGGDSDVGPLSGLASFIGGWYKILTELSWTVMVPLFVAILIVSLVLFKKMDRGGAIKKIVVRILFIGIGLPLLGSMYTGVLDSMQDASSSGNTGSARVVMSTYVDFQGWAMNSRLAVPSGATIEWDPSTDQPSGKAQAQVRNTTLAINNWTHGTDLSQIVSGDKGADDFAQQVMDGRATDRASSSKTFSTAYDMLDRFMKNKQVSAADFETIAKGDTTQSPYFQSNGDEVKKWFDDLNQKADDLNKYDPTQNPVVAVKSGTGLKVSGTGDDVHKFSSNVSSCSASGTQVATGGTGSNAGTPRSCNLSPLAMYNYLNTDFDSTSMKMYSSSDVASEATRSIHNSVDQVGTGTMSVLYWIDAVVLLGSFVLVGVGYAMALLFGSIKRSIQIVTSVPFATIGALAAIGKVLVYSAALILELIVTVFVYKLVQELLTSLPQLLEMPFAAFLNNGSSGALANYVTWLVSGWGFTMTVTLVSIIGIIMMTILALRVRKSVVKAMEEAVTKIVEKFLSTGVGMPAGGKLGPALAGGLAQGAGAAAANRMVTGGKGPSATSAPKPGSPGSVSTAGGIADTGPGPDGSGDGRAEITAETGPAPGNGDAGSPIRALPGGDGGDAASKEVALGRSIEQNGLTKPGETKAPQVQGDVTDAATKSLEQSAEGYKAADRKQLEAGKDAAAATGHAAIATGRGVAGDYKGAAESGGKAVKAGGEAVAKGQEAKQAEKDTGRSSLDQPKQKGAQTGATARRVSQAGDTVSKVAGTTGGSSSKSARGSSTAPKAPAAARPSKPVSSAPRAPQSKPSSSQPAPTAAPKSVAPRPQSASRPAPAAPTPSRGSGQGKAAATSRPAQGTRTPQQPARAPRPIATQPRAPKSSDK